MHRYQPLMSEAMRPKVLTDLTLPAPLLAKFQRMVETKSVLNMVFHGAPGTGKTSAARIIADSLQAAKYDVNGALNTGINTVMGDLANWANAASLMIDEPKLCVIDEADQLSSKQQTALSYIIENSSGQTRFILTTNNINKICDPIKSRCEPINFDVCLPDRAQIIERVTSRWLGFIVGAGATVSQERCRQIVQIYFPDFRRIASQIQLEMAT